MLYGFSVETDNGTEFGIVVATCEQDAILYVCDAFPQGRVRLHSVEGLIGEQYNGLALLTTG